MGMGMTPNPSPSHEGAGRAKMYDRLSLYPLCFNKCDNIIITNGVGTKITLISIVLPFVRSHEFHLFDGIWVIPVNDDTHPWKRFLLVSRVYIGKFLIGC